MWVAEWLRLFLFSGALAYATYWLGLNPIFYGVAAGYLVISSFWYYQLHEFEHAAVA